MFLYYPAAGKANVAMNLRLFETSRGTVESGVAVPIVRDGDLFTATSWLVNIPNEPLTTRVHLRVYFVSASVRQAEVRVRVHPGDSQIAVTDHVLRSTGSSDAGGVPPPGIEPCVGAPAYGIELLTPFLRGESETFRVRVDPLTPDLTFWPMVSVTSNERQYVSLIIPR